jgi:hypothetical protein
VVLPVVALAGCGPSERVAPAVHPEEPIVAAVVRGDGFLVPYAEYVDGRWQGPAATLAGPGFPAVTDRPSAWFADRMDALGRWRLLTPLGLADHTGGRVDVRVTGPPAELATHCERAWALPTDLPGTPTPAFTVHQNIGVAFSAGGRPLPAAELEMAPAEMDRAIGFLTPYFDAAEAREVERRSREGGDVTRRVGAHVATTPLDVTMLYRVGGSRGMSYYTFEASRSYAPSSGSPMPDCGDATVMTGWMSEDSTGAFVLLSNDIAMINCFRKGTPLVQPMAALAVDGQLFIFTVDRHYEGESYSIVAVTTASADQVLTVYGGGC